MREAIDRFRRQVYRNHPRRPRNAIRYPPALQRRVVAFARKREAEGGSLWRISGELGLGQETLRDWIQRHPEPRFRSVKVATPDPTPAPKSLPSALVLVTPQGYRVEGLEPDSLAVLLRTLA
ncbi:MAG: hypothetical protein L0191_05210 [Acidobacteria bacterium]|nr:hypothetical protein [Acidobacteriota bacterium]MCI0656920.1 hypothetical protein [Acidobacteriota bacterium]